MAFNKTRKSTSIPRRSFFALFFPYICGVASTARASPVKGLSSKNVSLCAEPNDVVAFFEQYEPEMLFNTPFGIVSMFQSGNALVQEGEAGIIVAAFGTANFPSSYSVALLAALPSDFLSLEVEFSSNGTVMYRDSVSSEPWGAAAHDKACHGLVLGKNGTELPGGTYDIAITALAEHADVLVRTEALVTKALVK